MEKLNIDNMKRPDYGYKAAFEGELYHLVRNREDSTFTIENNLRNSGDPRLPKLIKDPAKMPFNKQKARDYKHLISELSESRFETSPKKVSPHTPRVNMEKSAGRGENIYE